MPTFLVVWPSGYSMGQDQGVDCAARSIAVAAGDRNYRVVVEPGRRATRCRRRSSRSPMPGPVLVGHQDRPSRHGRWVAFTAIGSRRRLSLATCCRECEEVIGLSELSPLERCAPVWRSRYWWRFGELSAECALCCASCLTYRLSVSSDGVRSVVSLSI